MSYNLHRCQISLKTWPDPASLLPWYQNSFEDKTSQELQQPHKKESSPQTNNGSYCQCQCQFKCQRRCLFLHFSLSFCIFDFCPPIYMNQCNVATILLLGVVCQKWRVLITLITYNVSILLLDVVFEKWICS